MGRTQRKRSRKKVSFRNLCLDNTPSIIALNAWMKQNGWPNDNHLRLSLFETTGRGLTSSKAVPKSTSLIEVPYELMITYTTLEKSFPNKLFLPKPSEKLKMHDLLSIYLVLEKHKGSKSEWKAYIHSLPKDIPPLPWLCTSDEITKIDEELKAAIQSRVAVFESSWERSQKALNPRWKCACCGGFATNVFTLNTFTWAYVMVNTRSVYVDPKIIRELSWCSPDLDYVLADEPCMAMCPYLDMFNHSNKAETHAELVNVHGRWFFTLTISTETKKYEEIFISYGPHDNIKLFCEYGFFIPDDELYFIKLDLRDILKITTKSIDGRQYKFIRGRCLDSTLHVDGSGLSFNLKAVLFVILNEDVANWCPYVFSDGYSKDDLLQMYSLVKPVIEFKIVELSGQVSGLEGNLKLCSESFKNVLNYLRNKLDFMQKVCDKLLSIQ